MPVNGRDRLRSLDQLPKVVRESRPLAARVVRIDVLSVIRRRATMPAAIIRSIASLSDPYRSRRSSPIACARLTLSSDATRASASSEASASHWTSKRFAKAVSTGSADKRWRKYSEYWPPVGSPSTSRARAAASGILSRARIASTSSANPRPTCSSAPRVNRYLNRRSALDRILRIEASPPSAYRKTVTGVRNECRKRSRLSNSSDAPAPPGTVSVTGSPSGSKAASHSSEPWDVGEISPEVVETWTCHGR